MPGLDKPRARTGWTGFRKALCYAALISFTLLLVAFAGICFSIRSGVQEIARTAVHHYPGDRVEALMKYAESPNHSLAQRNRAVWALGQIGDKRALPLLENHRTGQPCDHGSALCQREIAKAIDACNGAFNATAWLPR